MKRRASVRLVLVASGLVLLLAFRTRAAADGANASAGLLVRAESAYAAKDYAAAESLATRALEHLDANASADSLPRASALLIVARALVSQHLLADGRALDAAARALAITEAAVPEGDLRRGEAHYVTAWVLSSSGRTEGVGDHGRRALEIQRRALGNDSEPVAVTLRLLALDFERLGLADSARASYVEAVAIRERLDLPRDRLLGGLHLDLSRLEESCGNMTEARAQTDLALREFQTRLGVDDAALVQVWRRYSSLEWGAGDYSRAADFGERALAAALADPQGDPLDLAILRGALAWPLYSLEDYPRARQLLSEAIPVLTARLGPVHPQTVRYRTTLIQILPALGDTAAALAEIRSLRASLGSDSTQVDVLSFADLLCTEADLLAADDPAVAIALCDRALAMVEREPSPDPAMEIQASSVLLIAQARRQDWAAVDRTINALQAALDRLPVRGLPTEIWALEHWAGAEDRRGRFAEAFRHALDASRQSRAVLLRNLRSLPDREGLRFSAGRYPPVPLLVGLTTSTGAASSVAAWDELVRWRGLVGAEIRGRRTPRGAGVDEKVTAAHAAWARAKSRLAQMETRFAAGGGVEGGEASLDSLRAEEAATEREWAKVAPRLAGATRDVGLEEIRAALGVDDALVSFSLAQRRDDPERMIAFVVRGGESDASVRALDLGPARGIHDALERWLERASRSPRGDAAAERACRAAGITVRERAWDPVAFAVDGSADVYIVADGPLHELPWGALPVGEGRYLVEGSPTVHVLDAERDLVDRAGQVDGTGRGMLAIGGIDFEAGKGKASMGDSAPLALLAVSSRPPGCAGAMLRALAPLPGTEREVRAIAKERADAQLLTGGDATEAAFKRLASGLSVVHLATHGIVLASDCAESTPGTRGVGGFEPLESGKPAAAASRTGALSREHPSPWLGRRTFLALAGANRARDHLDDENEGFLTAEEVSTLDLRGTEWVVLSACRSGVAESWQTEGVLGMRRAFRLAGARSVIASQWDVDDDATREWMTVLYERASGTESAAKAVQRASRSILQARRADGRSTHPFYWAAFTASGE